MAIESGVLARGAMILVSKHGAITYANPQAVRALGLQDGVVGRTLHSLADEMGDMPLADVAAALRAGQVTAPTELPADARRPALAVLPSDTGIALVVLPAEWKERSLHQDDSRRSLLESVLRSVRDAVLVTAAEPLGEPGPVIVYANAAFERATGYTLDEVIGRSPRLLQGPDTDRAVLDRLRRALEKWESVTVELINYRKDGSPFWVEIDITPIADETGWCTHWVSVQRDITERKAQEAQREEQARLIQTILDSLHSRTAMLDADGVIMAVNRPWHEAWVPPMPGIPEPHWIGSNYLDACTVAAKGHGPDAAVAADVSAGIRRVLGGSVPTFELDYECSDESQRRWFHMYCRRIDGQDGVVVSHTDITQRKELEAELGHLAWHDSLTGLPNRDQLLQSLATRLHQARRKGTVTAVAFLDLDNFKDVNDTYGHKYGDVMLEEIASRLRESLRPDDMVARLGGDEFVLVLSDLPESWDPVDFFNRLRKSVGRRLSLGVVSIHPSISVGLVMAPPHDGDVDTVLRDADSAMYASKRSGRDRLTLFDSTVRDVAVARMVSDARLSAALKQEEFEIHLQPIVDLNTGEAVASEALLRLRDPDVGLLYPADFLAALDNGPLAEDVGTWVIAKAVRQGALWRAFDPDHAMSVNVSPRQLGRGRLPGIVERVLTDNDFPAGQLILEITEEFVVEVAGAATRELRALRAMGVKIALDDFGTGYSALSYLRDFPVDYLKVDRGFIDAATHSPESRSLLSAISHVAGAVGSRAIAEGIETEQHLEIVLEAGITLGQGFLLGRPAEAGGSPARTDVEFL